MKKHLLIFFVMSSISLVAHSAVKLHDPLFGPNVFIFDTSMDAAQINNAINQIYNSQRFNEFGENRYALLFKPGNYGGTIDIKVGYYTQVLGLGKSPDDVVITGALRTQDAPPGDPSHPDHGPGALTNFWRAAENLAVIPTLGSLGYPQAIPKDENVWAVSQASPLRRIHIKNGSLRLFEIGWSSGGFLANSKVDNAIITGSQQQWLSRNASWGNWIGGVWNMVFVGTTGAIPPGAWPDVPNTVIDKTPIISEKPFLIFDTVANQYAVMVPDANNNSSGENWNTNGTLIPISDFYIAQPNTDTAASINNALQQNKHLMFAPGVYHLSDSIRVTHPNTVVMGLGIATLLNENGQPAMIIADVDGVKLSGVLFDAGPISSTTLLQVGPQTSTTRHTANPTFLYDIFCRVGGASHPGIASSCVIINSNDVVGDYFWLWRADHGAHVGWDINKADTGLIVNGAYVTLYGLAPEHFEKYQTIWNGEYGATYFYQSEIPYDPPSQAAWKSPTGNGYASYKVANEVTSHLAYGVGVYCFFRDAENIFLDNAIESPEGCSVQFNHMVNIWLDGRGNTGINHIINGLGNPVRPGNVKSTMSGWPTP